MTLNDLKIGQSGIITAVGGEGALRLRLLDMGLIPKTRVRVQKVAPMGDPIQIQVRGYELTIPGRMPSGLRSGRRKRYDFCPGR